MVLATVVALGLTGTAHAEPATQRSAHLDRAVGAIDERDYVEARGQLRLALRAGQHSHADTVLIYRLAGEVAAAFGHRAAAERFFRHMLSIAPRAEVAEAEAPGVVRPYDAARAWLSEREALTIELARDREAGVVTVRVAADPLELVRAVRLIYGAGERRGQRELPWEGGDVPVELPQDQLDTAWITVVDRYGNHLMAAERALEPLEPPEPVGSDADDELEIGAGGAAAVTFDPVAGQRTDSPGDERSFLGRWYVWATLSVGAAGTAVFFGMQANEDWRALDQLIDESPEHDFAEADALEQSGRQNALYTNIAIGAAVTTAAVSTLLAIRDLASGSDSKKKKQTLGATPLRGGAAVTYRVGF